MAKSGIKLTLCFQRWVVATVDARPEGRSLRPEGLKCEARRAELRGRRLRVGVGFLEEGSEPPPTMQLRGLGGAVCKLPQRVRGGAPTANAFWSHSEDTKRI